MEIKIINASRAREFYYPAFHCSDIPLFRPDSSLYMIVKDLTCQCAGLFDQELLMK